MNTTEHKIINMALENLRNNANIECKWKEHGKKETDALITFDIFKKRKTFFANIKKEIRLHQIQNLEHKAQKYEPFILVAERIFPNIKTVLRKKKIPYLEANGNIYIQEENIFLWIETQKPLQKEKENINHAFTKTGLKVIFNFLIDFNLINLPYRKIAEKTKVALGIITNVFTGLKEKRFVIKIDKTRYKIINKDDLLNHWIERYEEKLKPDLLIGTFHFNDKKDFTYWKKIKFNNNDTVWGGEPAAELLTNYLNAEMLTIYTNDTKTDLIKNYRLIPDSNGNVKVYKKFWKTDKTNLTIAPPILIYADLINTGDTRNIETARGIYNDYIKDKYQFNT